MSLSKIVEMYKNVQLAYEQADVDKYKECKTFEYLLKRAIVGLTSEGERDSHKNRRRHEEFRQMYDNLKSKEEDILECKSFDQIMMIVYHAACQGFGPLSVYDTAIAIGSYLNIYPEKVYLHTGAYEGANNLVGSDNLIKKIRYFNDDKDYPYIELYDFPLEMHTLSPLHVENLLCYYRIELGTVK